MDKSSRILVLGHRGLVGGAIERQLAKHGYEQVRSAGRAYVWEFDAARTAMRDVEYVFCAAGTGGGIKKNLESSWRLSLDTMHILGSVLPAALDRGVRRLIWFACACIYPVLDRPATEQDLWGGPLEPTSRAFAAATLAGIELTRAYNAQHGTEFLALCPPTLYGPGDTFSEDGHVLAAMIRKCHEAKVAGAPEVTFWGSGHQRRQFLYVEDLARAAVEIMQSSAFAEWGPLLNVAGHPARRLDDVAESVADVVGYTGRIRWDTTKPEGAPRKEITGGWALPGLPTMLRDGVKRTYEWYQANLPGAGKTAEQARL